MASRRAQHGRLALLALVLALPLSVALAPAPADAAPRTPAPAVSVDAPRYSATDERTTVRATVSLARGQRVALQRKHARGWRTVGRSATLPDARSRTTTGGSATVTLRVPARAGAATYRVVVAARSGLARATSASFAVHQTNARKHRAYLARARSVVARYCGDVPIRVDVPAVAKKTGGSRLGLAWYSLRTSRDGTGTLTTGIALRSGLTGSRLRHVALHECAHVVQYRVRVDGKAAVTQLRDRSATLYGARAAERQADCMAYVHVKARAHVRHGSCTRSQRADARRMWARYGTTYDAAPYRGPVAR